MSQMCTPLASSIRSAAHNLYSSTASFFSACVSGTCCQSCACCGCCKPTGNSDDTLVGQRSSTSMDIYMNDAIQRRNSLYEHRVVSLAETSRSRSLGTNVLQMSEQEAALAALEAAALQETAQDQRLSLSHKFESRFLEIILEDLDGEDPAKTRSMARTEPRPSEETVIQRPELILDCSSRVITNCNRNSIGKQLARLLDLEIPIRTLALPSTEDGKAESLIKSVGSSALRRFNITLDVRANISSHRNSGGELAATRVRDSLNKSLEKIRVDGVTCLVAQRPDEQTPLPQVAGGFHALVAEDLCTEWAVRDFPERTMKDLLITCERRGHQPPLVYQTEFNLLRQPDANLMALLRDNNIKINAYHPAAGLPANRIEYDTSTTGERSATSSITHHSWTDEPTRIITDACRLCGLTPQNVALRWLAYHSELGGNDSIILDAHSPKDLEQQTRDIADGPLPNSVLCLLPGHVDVGFVEASAVVQATPVPAASTQTKPVEVERAPAATTQVPISGSVNVESGS